jgi:hypothetical protein
MAESGKANGTWGAKVVINSSILDNQTRIPAENSEVPP